MFTMFEKLQELPLLMGLGISDLMRIVEKVNFDFQKHPEGSTIVSQGERCDRIIYVLGGSVCSDRRDATHNMLVSEYFDDVPYVLECQNLWGMNQKFEHSYTFVTEGSTCSIDKRHLNMLISDYEIVKTNLLNLVCNKLQTARAQLKQPIPNTVELRVMQFIANNTLKHPGKKIFRVKMTHIAEAIDTPRINVSDVLNRWQEQQLVELRRGGFIIHNSEALSNSVKE